MRAPHESTDWLQMYRAFTAEPAAAPRGIDADRRSYKAHNYAAGPMRTPDTIRIARAIEQARFANEHAPLGGRRLVVVNGESALGKTHGVVLALLEDLTRCWMPKTEDELPHRCLYVEADPAGEGRALLRSLHHAADLPFGKSDTTSDLTARLRRLARPIGIELIAIDDIGSPQPSGQRALDMASQFKALVTARSPRPSSSRASISNSPHCLPAAAQAQSPGGRCNDVPTGSTSRHGPPPHETHPGPGTISSPT